MEARSASTTTFVVVVVAAIETDPLLVFLELVIIRTDISRVFCPCWSSMLASSHSTGSKETDVSHCHQVVGSILAVVAAGIMPKNSLIR
jgi:hypothetical protein